MLRISIPGGGPITSEQWDILDRVADMRTIRPSDTHPNARPSLRITTRQNIQLHWVRKKDVVDTISEIAKSSSYAAYISSILFHSLYPFFDNII